MSNTGSGRGIGCAAAAMFAEEGAMVIISDIDSQPAIAATNEGNSTLDSSWRRATTHGSRTTTHGGKRHVMGHFRRF